MRVHFNIHYRVSKPDEELQLLILSTQQQGAYVLEQKRMHSIDGENWTLCLQLDPSEDYIHYRYSLHDSRQELCLRCEPRQHYHSLYLSCLDDVYSQDHWIEERSNASLDTKALETVLYRQPAEPIRIATTARRLLYLQVFAAVPTHRRLYISGSIDTLGNWQVAKALPFSYQAGGYWAILLPIDSAIEAFEYKFFIADDNCENLLWESTSNRQCRIAAHLQMDLLAITGLRFEQPEPQPRLAGTVIPLFALRSQEDWGIGDFGTLSKFIDWAAATEQSFVQLLPINDTTYYRDRRDSYPYNAISVMALHPIYADLNSLCAELPKQLADDLHCQAKQLRAKPHIDYPAVLSHKERAFKVLYQAIAAQTLSSPEYLNFYTDSKEWLVPYAHFCTLRDEQPGRELKDWAGYPFDGESFRADAELATSSEAHRYHCFVQYLLHCQLERVSQHATELGVALKGDIPIGVSPNSVELCIYPDYFDSARRAGAPPDDFAADGQNWGFPCYRWAAMQSDGYTWWRRRLQHMSQYFQAFRIDHILGFFRIWQIPDSQCSGLLGQFQPAIGFSPSEIAAYGIRFDASTSTRALLSTEDLKQLIGPHFDKLIPKYLFSYSDSQFTLASPYDSQVAIQAIDPEQIAGGEKTKAALMQMATEIPFLPDSSEPNRYHPRILFQSSIRYQSFSETERAAWQKMAEEYFYHRNEQLWKETALERLAALVASTQMLVCAEDLGMIPAAVPEVLDQLNLLSLELERMPKQGGQEFALAQNFPYNSVATSSTHDMPSLRHWWQQDRERSRRYAAELLKQSVNEEQCSSTTAQLILANLLASPAMLAIIPLSDWMACSASLQALETAEEQQINHPEDPQHYWNYRVPIDIGALICDQLSFNAQLRRLIRASGRSPLSQ